MWAAQNYKFAVFKFEEFLLLLFYVKFYSKRNSSKCHYTQQNIQPVIKDFPTATETTTTVTQLLTLQVMATKYPTQLKCKAIEAINWKILDVMWHTIFFY